MDGLNFDFEFSITEYQKLKGGRKEGLTSVLARSFGRSFECLFSGTDELIGPCHSASCYGRSKSKTLVSV